MPAVPSPTRLAPQTSGDPPLSATELAAVDQALVGGAYVDELVEIVMKLRRRPGLQSPDEWEADRMLEEVLWGILGSRWKAYREIVKAEYLAFPKRIKDVFAWYSPKLDDQIDVYWHLRGDFLAAGYDPRVVFARIVPAELFGIEITNGVHAEVRGRLEQLNRDVPDPIQREIRRQLFDDPTGAQIIGFQPRRIAGSDVLSNHAFGLALDVNALSNPMVKGAEVKRILSSITKGAPGAPDGYDFGHSLVAGEVQTDEQLEQLYALAKAASEAVRKWLDQAITAETSFRFVISLDEDDVKSAQAALAAALKRHAPPAEIAKLRKALDDAKATLRAAKARYENDPDMRTLHALERAVWTVRHGRATISVVRDIWAVVGIVTVPLELVRLLKHAAPPGVAGFRWGAEYKESKDIMHFELLYRHVDPATGAFRR